MKKQQKNMFLIIIFLILILFYFFKYLSREYFETNKNIVLVIARYNEDLEFLKEEPFNKYDVIIYNKGDNDNFYKPPKLRKVIDLDNIGMNIHTYFYHIINNYDNLDDITVFLGGSCMIEDIKKDMTLKTIKYTEDTKNTVFIIHSHTNKSVDNELYDFTLENWAVTNKTNFKKNNDTLLRLCDIRPFGKWYQHVFNDIEIYDISYKALFSVSKEHIQNRSKESYIELMSYVNKDKNEESAHYFERALLAIFHPIPEKCLYR